MCFFFQYYMYLKWHGYLPGLAVQSPPGVAMMLHIQLTINRVAICGKMLHKLKFLPTCCCSWQHARDTPCKLNCCITKNTNMPLCYTWEKKGTIMWESRVLHKNTTQCTTSDGPKPQLFDLESNHYAMNHVCQFCNVNYHSVMLMVLTIVLVWI